MRRDRNDSDRHARFTRRALLLGAGQAALLGGLGARQYWLTMVEGGKYKVLADDNRIGMRLQAPSRGLVFDRNGQVLVVNRHSYSISIVREHTKDLNRTIQLLASVLGVDEAGVRAIVDRHRREPTFRPITIVQDATLAQVAAVTARRLDFELPDVVVEEMPTRRYPTEEMAAHLFGYVGEVSDVQVADNDDLKSGDIVGQSGIEMLGNEVERQLSQLEAESAPRPAKRAATKPTKSRSVKVAQTTRRRTAVRGAKRIGSRKKPSASRSARRH